MTSIGRGAMIVATLVLMAVPAFSTDSETTARPEPVAGQDAQVASEHGPPPEGHREDPVEPPETPIKREDMARSPRASVVLGAFQSIQVNVDALQNNIVGDAANEPSMAIDPTDPDNIVIGWRQFDTIASDFRQAGMAYSHDGGASWTFPGVLDPGQFRSDPVLAADNNGDFFYYSLSTVTTTEYFVSTDKGVNWSGPTSSPGGDKNWQTLDLSGGIGDGHIYPIWNSQFTCCAPGTDFTRSTDSAMTFEGPYVLPSHPKWGTNDVGPDGELYIVGATLDGSGHLILRSDNAEDSLVTPTFPQVTSISLGGTTGSGGTPNPGGLLGQVWVAVDRSTGSTRGNVYVLGSVNPPGSDPLDVHIIRSEDGGATWTPPVRINDDPSGNGAWQWFGAMSVAPDGRIDVTWNDTRAGPATISEVYYAYSNDAGTTWSAGLAVTPSFDSTIGHPVQNKIGDYTQMISSANDAALAFPATFNGEEDVYFLRVGDCNANASHDSSDIALMTSPDVNTNGIPDECEPDCNNNGIPDSTDITGGGSDDCNSNGVPDECDTADDCDGNGILDECETTYDLESIQGFTVDPGDTATTGIWVRVDPIGTGAQPEDDHTPSPGSMCFVTGQGTVGGGLGENDVDNGTTTLISPTIDLSAFSDPHIGYWRWYSNVTGGDPGADIFVVDISNDGGTGWSNVEVVGPVGAQVSGGWFYYEFRVSDVVTPTANVQVRWVASDLAGGSVIEAAVDDVVVLDCAACTVSLPGEVVNVQLSLTGTTADLTWDAVVDAATYDLYRGTQRDASDLACYLQNLVSTSTSDDGLVPSVGDALFYVTTSVNCAGDSTLGTGRTTSTPCP